MPKNTFSYWGNCLTLSRFLRHRKLSRTLLSNFSQMNTEEPGNMVDMVYNFDEVGLNMRTWVLNRANCPNDRAIGFNQPKKRTNWDVAWAQLG